jgi:hypothetical protein
MLEKQTKRHLTEGVLGVFETSDQDITHLVVWLEGIHLAIVADSILSGKVLEFLPSC